MLARLICFLLNHVFDELRVYESPYGRVYVKYGKCVRCGAPIVEVRDLRDEGLVDTVDERTPAQRG